MKKLLMMAAVAALVCSCSKEEMKVESGMESTLYLSVCQEPDSKASGAGHGVQADDNTVQTLEVFIFNNNPDNPDDGYLDTYRKFTSEDLSSTSKVAIQTTTGSKTIYVIANSHRENWKDVNTRTQFEAQTAQLTDEKTKNFIMTGSTETTLSLTSEVTVQLRRLVARVQLGTIKTRFAGGPYDGMALTDVKAYLINVQGSKYMYNGEGNNLLVLNKGKYVESDAASCAMPGAIYESLPVSLTDAGYNTPIYFYCYENSISRESTVSKYTRVVIEGKLNGITYYYPVIMKDIARNTCYSLDITITRPGSLDPGTDLQKGTMQTTINIVDWEVEGNGSVEF